MAAATASSTSIRYAPEDPTLPKPWKGLVDGKTGYLYFWNPETNVTQYERPVGPSNASSAPSHKSLSSSVQRSPQQNHSGKDDEDRYNKGSSGGSAKLSSSAGTYETARNRSDYSQNDPDIKTGVARGPYTSKDTDNGLSTEDYRRRHEITVSGDNVPRPFTTFEATGFPSEILREVRYLLHGGAKCRTLCRPPVEACMYLERPYWWTNLFEGLSESFKLGRDFYWQ